MKFDISIKNFGKINNADIQIRPFTVIAGPNSSGKSFVTKALYSFLNTLTIDWIAIKTFSYLNDIKNSTSNLNTVLLNRGINDETSFTSFQDKVNNIEEKIESIFNNNIFSERLSNLFLLQIDCKDLENSFFALMSDIKLTTGSYDINSSNPGLPFESGLRHIGKLKKIATNSDNLRNQFIGNGFVDALKENFQVSSIKELKNYHSDDNSSVSFDFGTLGKIEKIKESLSYSLINGSMDELENLSNVVYLESPVYWKLMEPLVSVKDNKLALSRSRLNKVEYLTGVPKHFYDLVDLLKNKIKTSEKFEFEQSAIKKAIGGEIKISNLGELYFLEEGNTNMISLHITALGIVNLGIIALLLEKEILSKGSYLFIDEPEAHLHPSWQKILIETLFELSKKGINIVIATHSIDMIKCIENIMEKEKTLDIKEHFGINQLSANGDSLNISENVFKRLAATQEDLGKSFYEMTIDTDWI